MSDNDNLTGLVASKKDHNCLHAAFNAVYVTSSGWFTCFTVTGR